MFIRELIDHDIPGDPHFLARAAGWVAERFSQGAAGRMDAYMQPQRAYWSIGCTVGLWALAVLIANLTNRFNIEYNRRIGEKVMFSIRKALFAHLQRLSMSYYGPHQVRADSVARHQRY